MIDYQDYYEKQTGSGLPVFNGAKHQKGYGLGNVFRSFYRWIAPVFKVHAMPLLKDGAQAIGTEAVKTIANVANDTLDGDKFSESIRKRSKEAINTLAEKAQYKLQKGEGYKRKNKRAKKAHSIKRKKPLKRKQKSCKKKKSKKQRTKLDIFDSL
jgi:hypothetical protein